VKPGGEGRAIVGTERLELRELSFADAVFVAELLNDPDFLRFIGDRGVRTEEDARGYLEKGPLASYARHGFGLYAVVTRDSVETAGICGLLQRDWLDEPDVGFAYLPRFRGRGYALEAASAILDDAARRLGLARVGAIVSPENERSLRVLAKLGFRYERVARPPGEDADVHVLAWTAPAEPSAAANEPVTRDAGPGTVDPEHRRG
jgi:RimJ/RimL family protein N-acetyltransferase